MEALILIFGELVFALLAPFVTLVVDLVASIIGVLVSLFAGGGSGSIATGGSSRGTRVAKTVTLILAGLAVLILAILSIVNSFYFDNAVRYVFGMAEKRSGVATTCNAIDGSFFAGRVALDDCTIQRRSHQGSTFELSVSRVEFDLRMTSLLGTAHIESAKVAGLSGWVDHAQSGKSTPERVANIEKPRRAFEIGKLDITNTNIELSGMNADGALFELAVNVEYLSSEPLRSRLALFDILFRSNARGSIAGAPFEIATAEIEDGRQTLWRSERVPVASFGALVGGPLSWFTDGYVDIAIDDRWQRGDSLVIDMDWRLEFSDIRVAAPPGTGAVARLASEPLTRFVNSRNGNLPLEFQLVINESQFEHQWNLEAAGLWSAVSEAVNRLLSSLGINMEKAAETADTIRDGARSVLDRLRKPKAEEPE